MMRALLFLFSLFFIAACAQPKYVNPADSLAGTDQALRLDKCVANFASGDCVSMAWEKMPTENDFGTFLFKIYRPNLADGTPVVLDPSGKTMVLLWMPAMGHGSSPITVERLDVGTFRASKVFFTMKGSWEIRFQVKNGSELSDQAVVTTTF